MNNLLYGFPDLESGNAISGDRNGIIFQACTNCLIQGNEISHVDHGTALSGTMDIKYNYIHNTNDDCIFILGGTTTAADIKIIGNVCAYNGNNGLDAGGSITQYYAANNTFIDIYDSPILITAAGTVVLNNIIYISAFGEAGEHLIWASNYPVTDSTVDYNIYYLGTDSGGSGPDFLSLSTEYNFTGWQALGADTNSEIIDPHIAPTGKWTGQTILPQGSDLSNIFTQLLSQEAIWSVGNVPSLQEISIWKAGAFTGKP
ncbi:MAG TPA: right-handed parallel beta-helix repeat-containing protein [Nitrospirae bacterium]|nr:right-handed parallel beta-helix repeat-containing protein [Nitrospirota bacterium]HDH50033.1 right-handed parallel beta-helix repeat-containing protein [Nitrospirota bacterium]HDZ84138.1 right-handed parallel beta-helix repeat-containing protein [Nitrospirota bacterium]